MSWLRPTTVRTVIDDVILGVDVNVHVIVDVDVDVDVDECSLPYRHIRLSMDLTNIQDRIAVAGNSIALW
jgi:hypothetical protein